MSLPMCCMDLEINLSDLLFPELMNADGRHFVTVHGLHKLTLGELQANSRLMDNGMVRIAHRCDQLRDDGCCAIYHNRPRICGLFDCTTRSDCECKGSGRLCNSV